MAKAYQVWLTEEELMALQKYFDYDIPEYGDAMIRATTKILKTLYKIADKKDK